MAPAQPPTIEEITATYVGIFSTDARIRDLKLQRDELVKRIGEAAHKTSACVTVLPMQRALQALEELTAREETATAGVWPRSPNNRNAAAGAAAFPLWEARRPD